MSSTVHHACIRACVLVYQSQRSSGVAVLGLVRPPPAARFWINHKSRKPSRLSLMNNENAHPTTTYKRKRQNRQVLGDLQQLLRPNRASQRPHSSAATSTKKRVKSVQFDLPSDSGGHKSASATVIFDALEPARAISMPMPGAALRSSPSRTSSLGAFREPFKAAHEAPIPAAIEIRFQSSARARIATPDTPVESRTISTPASRSRIATALFKPVSSPGSGLNVSMDTQKSWEHAAAPVKTTYSRKNRGDGKDSAVSSRTNHNAAAALPSDRAPPPSAVDPISPKPVYSTRGTVFDRAISPQASQLSSKWPMMAARDGASHASQSPSTFADDQPSSSDDDNTAERNSGTVAPLDATVSNQLEASLPTPPTFAPATPMGSPSTAELIATLTPSPMPDMNRFERHRPAIDETITPEQVLQRGNVYPLRHSLKYATSESADSGITAFSGLDELELNGRTLDLQINPYVAY